jgi:hypothetical protein
LSVRRSINEFRESSRIALAAAAAMIFSTVSVAVHADEAKIKCQGVPVIFAASEKASYFVPTTTLSEAENGLGVS